MGSKECERVIEDGPRMERGVRKDDSLLGGSCQDWRGLWSIDGMMLFMGYGVWRYVLCFGLCVHVVFSSLLVLFIGIIVQPQCSSPMHATHPRYARTMLSRISNGIIV